MSISYHSQGNVGLSGKPGPKVSEQLLYLKLLLIIFSELSPTLATLCFMQLYIYFQSNILRVPAVSFTLLVHSFVSRFCNQLPLSQGLVETQR